MDAREPIRLTYVDTSVWNRLSQCADTSSAILDRLDQVNATDVVGDHAVHELAKTFRSSRPNATERAPRLCAYLAEYIDLGVPVIKQDWSLLIEETLHVNVDGEPPEIFLPDQCRPVLRGHLADLAAGRVSAQIESEMDHRTRPPATLQPGRPECPVRHDPKPGQAGDAANRGRDFEEAKRDFKQAVDLAEKIQPHDQRLVSALDHLGNEYFGQDPAAAEEAYERELKASEEIYGPQSLGVAAALQSLGRNALMQKDYATAEKLFFRAVDINEKIYGEGSDKVAYSLLVAAGVYVVQKDYAKAETYVLRALNIENHCLVTTELICLCRWPAPVLYTTSGASPKSWNLAIAICSLFSKNNLGRTVLS